MNRQLKDFVRNTESEFGDTIHYTKVRWLGRGRLLKCVYDLKLQTEQFLEM